ncbi:MAG TPA: hypothetical protein VI814_06335 [Candidatus Limnocylindria bacterium]
MEGDRGPTRGRKMRDAARRYMESMETERATLLTQVRGLTHALEQATKHHREAHPECVNLSVEGS